jgi:hypothetical protein
MPRGVDLSDEIEIYIQRKIRMTPGEIILGIIALFAVFVGVGSIQYNIRRYEKEERQRREQ